jgi:hypothetical protein
MDVKNNEDRGLIYSTFSEIVNMLRSNNQEDFRLAMSIVEEQAIDNEIALVFFWKHCSNNKKQLWKDEFPKSYSALQEATVNVGTSVNRIYNYARNNKLSTDEKKFIEDNISVFLHKTLVGYGFGFVKNMKIEMSW